MVLPKDYKDSLNLPKTDFSMKADLGKKEPEFLKKWEQENLYLQIVKKNKGKPPFILHDGPPYANSPIHLGTALNKILKDIVVRYKNMSGFLSEYIPGWDCHGLPIELQAAKKGGDKKKKLTPLETRQLCREHAQTYILIQKEQFKRLGVMGEWDKPYTTMSFEYEAQIVRELANLASKELLHRAKKVIHWCASCQTALAEAEIEYRDKFSPSLYVKFELSKESYEILSQKSSLLKKYKHPIYLLIWTTTPWTLPANLAIALHPELNYTAVKVKDEIYILAENRLEAIQKECGFEKVEVLSSVKAHELCFLKCNHPFIDRKSVILLADYVSADSGTGCVHIAPGHGTDDYHLGLKYQLDIFSPVDDRGCFTSEVSDYEGKVVFDTHSLIIERLRNSGFLLKASTLSHAYPHCWRCKNPLLFRATEQWFILIDKTNLRKNALEWIQKIIWIPPWGQRRIEGMMENRPDWCLSRQRVWGVPIPALHCKKCTSVICDPTFMEMIADRFEKEGGDYWFKASVQELISPGMKCRGCGESDFEKEKDILDVWFDSGCSFSAVLEKRDNLHYPADLYLEGSDQHRGWFHTSLLISIGTRGTAPYKSVLTHGFVVDAQGKKMSKSLGNVIEPESVITRYGAEILRLWVASENYQNDVPCSEKLLERCSEAYRKIRNTCKFMLGNLHDFRPEKDSIPYKNLLEIDQYALLKLQHFIEKSKLAYETYEFQNLFYTLNNYCIVDLSSFYLDILKDRLYTYGKKSRERLAAQTVLYEILTSLIKMIAPILIFTSEEVYQFMPGKKEKSIHLNDWPRSISHALNKDLEERWEKLLTLREHVLKNLEEARKNKIIGNSLEAKVTIFAPKELKKVIESTTTDFCHLFIVSQVDIRMDPLYNDLKIEIQKAEGQKCPRCWIWSRSVSSTQLICGKCTQALSNPSVLG